MPSLVAALLHDPQTAAIKAELKWLTGELGPARELDVLVHRVVALMKRRRRIWRGMSSTLRTTSFNTTYEAWIYRSIISLAWPLQRRRFAVRRDRLFDWPHVGKLPASLQPRRPDRLRARFGSADGSGSRNASRKPAAVASSVVAANWLARRFIKCVRLQLRQDASMVIMGQC
jgi:hypothetical protein